MIHTNPEWCPAAPAPTGKATRSLPAEAHARAAAGPGADANADRQSDPLRCELLAHELHDSVAQQLGFLAFQARAVESLLKGEGAAAGMVSEMRSVLGRLQKQVRELIAGARIGMEGRSLREALADAVHEFSRHSGIVFELDNRWGAASLGVGQELQVLHIVREALANVVRHSHATQVHVTLTEEAVAPKALLVRVEDNGTGLVAGPSGEIPGHYGLSIMRERAVSLGATLAFDAVPTGGLRIALRIPAGDPA